MTSARVRQALLQLRGQGGATGIACRARPGRRISLLCVVNPQYHGLIQGSGRTAGTALRPDTAWWRRGDASAVQRRRPSVQLGGQASILVKRANARDAVARCLSAQELRNPQVGFRPGPYKNLLTCGEAEAATSQSVSVQSDRRGACNARPGPVGLFQVETGV